ncbi:hypothetical protein ABZ572_23110 [Streptomyces sp. NPDC018338]|uniref:hypothetical protein n=1 Tax=Streptomyces sp. NPDC018338 TaxID=3157192 RepID=UPI0033E24E1A
MSFIRRTLTVGLSTVAMMGAMVSFGSTANAVTTACSTTPDGGSLCLRVASNGYDISYYKRSGAAAKYDFNLYCDNGRWFGDEGSFIAVAGQTKTYVFRVGSQGSCYGKLLNGTTGALIKTTPKISR